MNRITLHRVARTMKQLLCGGLLVIAVLPAGAATFTVTSTADTGGNCTATPNNCTLRQAITSANADVLGDTINFNLAGNGVHTITPATPLPTITRALSINGYSQTGALQNTSAIGFNAVLKIHLSGATNPGSDGLKVQSILPVTIRGLAISGFVGNLGGDFGRALFIAGSGVVNIRGCAIGTNANLSAVGNRHGVWIDDAQTGAVTIGASGDDATVRANRNLIADNSINDVVARPGSGTVNVLNNLIGTAPTGLTHFGDQVNGIFSARPGTVIRGNLIKGSDVGILLQAAEFEVSGNTLGFVQGDINPGTLSNGTGIRIAGAASGRGVIGGSGTLANLIARSINDGIEHSAAGIDVDFALNTVIAQQRPFDLLGVNGADSNDPDDPDIGPNGLQNMPVIVNATRFVDAANEPITISGTLNSLPNRSFRLVFHQSTVGTLGDVTTIATTDGSGDATFGPVQVVFPNANVVQIAATATLIDDVSGLPFATSEYSSFVSVQTIAPPVPLIVNSTADPGNGVCDAAECTLREAITAANANFNPQSIDLISFAIPGTAEQVHVIQVQSPMTEIDEAVTIDGYTQSGASPNTDATGVGSNADIKIVLAGGDFHFSNFVGTGASVTLRGLSITGFIAPETAGGLGMGSLNNRIEGCWFGVRPNGSEALTDMNISMQSVGGVFGGESPAQRNVFVNRRGLGLNDGRATNNLFGLLPDGRTAATVSAVVEFNGHRSALRAMNVKPTLIDNNIFATPLGIPAIIATNTQIIDNSFGESWDGTSTFSLGSAVRPDVNTVIRSSTRRIRGALNDAIRIDSSNHAGVIIIDQPIVGGQESGVEHGFGSNVSIRSSISGTALAGIDLNIGIPEPPFGVTLNDIHPINGPDVDNGPNGMQNFPELIAAFRGDATLTVLGMLTTLPNQDFRIVICGSASSHASEHGGCDAVLDDQTIVTTDADGLAEFTLTLPDDPAWQFVTATASRIITADVDEQTSEFALSIPITAEPALFADSFE